MNETWFVYKMRPQAFSSKPRVNMQQLTQSDDVCDKTLYDHSYTTYEVCFLYLHKSLYLDQQCCKC